jgi:hypothetical protein
MRQRARGTLPRARWLLFDAFMRAPPCTLFGPILLHTSFHSLWYTVAVRITLQQLAHRWAARVPYPLALQALLSLVLLATLPSALEAAGGALSVRFALLALVVGLDLAMCWVVPARHLRLWQQLAYLALQLGLA